MGHRLDFYKFLKKQEMFGALFKIKTYRINDKRKSMGSNESAAISYSNKILCKQILTIWKLLGVEFGF